MFVILNPTVTGAINRYILFPKHDFNLLKTYGKFTTAYGKSCIFDYNNIDSRNKLLIIERQPKSITILVLRKF